MVSLCKFFTTTPSIEQLLMTPVAAIKGSLTTYRPASSLYTLTHLYIDQDAIITVGLGNSSREQPRLVNGYLASSQEHVDVVLLFSAIPKRGSEVKVTAHAACTSCRQPRLPSTSTFTFHSLNYTAEHVCCHELAQDMAITAPYWSTKHHVHPRRFTDICQIHKDPKLKQTLAMSFYEAYITLVRATFNYIYSQLILAHYLKTYIYTTP